MSTTPMVTLNAFAASPSPILAAAMKMIVEMMPDTRLTASGVPNLLEK